MMTPALVKAARLHLLSVFLTIIGIGLTIGVIVMRYEIYSDWDDVSDTNLTAVIAMAAVLAVIWLSVFIIRIWIIVLRKRHMRELAGTSQIPTDSLQMQTLLPFGIPTALPSPSFTILIWFTVAVNVGFVLMLLQARWGTLLDSGSDDEEQGR
ncbi:hypothetical protein ANO11243_021890 [Dothideomycetidae sp. 11243]|nr:hypothetical protein ANO11243_021890 [fungal sp. No.11243]